MGAEFYVVHLIGTDDPKPFKHFGERRDATTYARSQVQSETADRADIYLVPDASNAYAAIAAIKVGAATLIESRSRRASPAEIEAASQQAWEHARKLGPDAVLKFLGLA